MAKTITPLDGYAILTQVARQATGQDSFAAVNASTFVSAGETVLATGTENVLNAVNIVLNRLVLAVIILLPRFTITAFRLLKIVLFNLKILLLSYEKEDINVIIVANNFLRI